jgi:multidrug efflux pump subunit AcrA (membrane-fusion protein)
MPMTKIRVVAFRFFLTSTMAVGPIALATPVKREGRKDPVSVASPCAGTVLIVGSEIKKGDQVPPEGVIDVQTGGKLEKYRRWKEGDRVKKGQLLVRLDDRLARKELLLQRATLAARKADYEAALALQKVYEKQLERLLALEKKRQLVRKKELKIARAKIQRFTREAVGKKAALKVAEREVEKAQTRLELHEIHSPVDGIIQTICTFPGAAVRAGEVVVTIRSGQKR